MNLYEADQRRYWEYFRWSVFVILLCGGFSTLIATQIGDQKTPHVWIGIITTLMGIITATKINKGIQQHTKMFVRSTILALLYFAVGCIYFLKGNGNAMELLWTMLVLDFMFEII